MMKKFLSILVFALFFCINASSNENDEFICISKWGNDPTYTLIHMGPNKSIKGIVCEKNISKINDNEIYHKLISLMKANSLSGSIPKNSSISKQYYNTLIKLTLHTATARHRGSGELFEATQGGARKKFKTINGAKMIAKSLCEHHKKTQKPDDCYIYSVDGNILNKDDLKIAKNLKEKSNENLKQIEIEKIKKEELDKLKKENEKLKAEKLRIIELDKLYGKQCEKSLFSLFNKGFEKGTVDYENCLNDKANLQLAKKKELSDEKKFLQEKLKNMSQMERIKYQCEKIFNFYKHSKKFKDCTLQVYVAESEATKIQLEKEVLLAQLESSKLKLKTAKLELEISKANEEAKRIAKLEQQKTTELEQQRKLLAKKETNNAKGLGSFLDLVSVGLQIYSLTSPTPSIGSGSSVSSAMQCFTSGMFQYCN